MTTDAQRFKLLEVRGNPVQQLRLQAPSGFDFAPGQYLCVEHESGQIPLSIASAPWRLPELHLYYRSTPGLEQARWMDELLAVGRDLAITGPGGDVILQQPLDTPLLLVSGGTGGAQALGMLDALMHDPPDCPVGLLWCADDADGLAATRALPVEPLPWLTSEFLIDPRRSADNRALERLRELAPDFAALLGTPPASARPRVVLSGSPGFVYAVTDLLIAAGLAADQLQSDVYAYAPRS
jgi:CDP-4-dehydro-6-deoxyglucose reductase